MTWIMFRYRVRRLWRKLAAPFRTAPLPALHFEETCEHDVQPTEDPDWGKCTKWGDATFPLTERAAWGAFECEICHDTGLVPVDADGRLADARCPACPMYGIGEGDE